MTKTAVVTGASSGIGEAAARRLAADGFELVIGARRVGRLESVAREIGARAIPLDVTDPESIKAFAEHLPRVDLLVNNAGGALGLDPIAEARPDDWLTMYRSNVMGLMYMTRELLPKLAASGAGHVINIGSIAGLEPYRGGAGYNAAKFATRAVTQVLRLELLGKPIRVTEVDPGMVETEFSIVRFAGDVERAGKIYAGTRPLVADDIADIIAWAAARPPHVNVDQVVVKPLAQAAAAVVYRGELDATSPLPQHPVAVVTGASSGIGRAAARQLAAAGFQVILGARRLDRLEGLAREIGGQARDLDVTDAASVRRFASSLPALNLLVNNAGLGLGQAAIAASDDETWRRMWETNVLGVVRVTRELLPKLQASGRGHILNVGSIGGLQVVEGGAGYTSTKHALRAITQTLRLELLGQPIRVTEIDPGRVETEFALIRSGGDEEAAARFYAEFQPLSPDDVAQAITWSATRPPHVNIDELVITPLAQASIRDYVRSASP